MQFLLPLLARYWRSLAAALVIAVVLGVTYFRGRSDGVASQQPEISKLKAAVETQNAAVESLADKKAIEDRSAKDRVSDSLRASEKVRASELANKDVGPDALNTFLSRTFP